MAVTAMEPASQRYYALDSMRAVMMLLGIYLHVVVGYSGDGNWPYIDPHPTPVLNFTLGIIHSFRMPAFFVMAGFFGALLWNTRGAASFIENRVRRILIPFLFFWVIMFPLVAAITINKEHGPQAILPGLFSAAILKRLHPMHLWFLEYLLILYALGAAVAWFSRRLPASLLPRLHAAYRWALKRSWAPALFAVLLSWGPLALMHGNLKDPDGVMPEWRIILGYIGPFWFGWLLYHHRDLLGRFEKHIWIYLACTVPSFLVYGLAPGATQAALKAAGNVLLCWLNIFLFTGLFLRYASRPSARWRYLSDSSYWLYIMHLPVVVGLQLAFAGVPLPALAKIPIVLALAVLVLVVSYDWLVRPRWIGSLLNGRRYARGLPGVPAQATMRV
jgi:glucans biosynthesis protein C